MSKIEARNFKGTRDYLPNEMLERNRIINTIKETFENYGFYPIETPALEYLDILLGKYGEEGDKLIYRLDYKGGNVLGMRYDLTIPVSRIVAQYPDLPMPFKRYQIQPVWRADSPQLLQGRFREFYQCDADIIGVKSELADAEIISLINKILKKLDIGKFVIKINHRLILRGIIENLQLDLSKETDLCRTIDKIEKIGIEEVKKELASNGFSDEQIKKIFEILSITGIENMETEKAKTLDYTFQLLDKLNNILIVSESAKVGISELKKIFSLLKEYGVDSENIKFDLSLARGLDYYTGVIYEAFSRELAHIGSLCGGGRYDNLISMLSGKDTPAVGTTIGLDRIYTLLKQQGKINEKHTSAELLICVFSEELIPDTIRIVSKLRDENINVDFYYKLDKLKKQFNYGNKINIPYVMVVGPDEIRDNLYTIKNMVTGTQEKLRLQDIKSYIRKEKD